MEAGIQQVDPRAIDPNPENPRRFFNDEQLDVLRTSIQEVGILVPLIAYPNPEMPGRYVLMDGERRWRGALDLGLDTVPVSTIPPPSPLENLLRMFNIHSVREDWPLIAIAYSLRNVMNISGEDRESRLAEMTGLTRATVRRAKRLLNLPDQELELIRNEAHLDRSQQVHREDLYLEIEQAEAVVRSELPAIAARFSRAEIIRSFASKAEEGTLRAVTEFRDVSKLVKAADGDLVTEEAVEAAVTRLIEDVEVTPERAFRDVAAVAYDQQSAARRAQLLDESLASLDLRGPMAEVLRHALAELRSTIDRLLES